MKLRDICNNNTAVQLKEIAKSHGLSGYSKMKKAELVELLVNQLLDYNTIEESLLLAEQNEFVAFEEIYKGQTGNLNDKAMDYVYFFMKGYININEKREISIPDEVKRMFPIINSEEFQKRRAAFHLILDYCKACVNLYGIVSIEQVCKVYNQNNKFDISKEELIDVVQRAQTRNCVVEIKDDQLVHELLMTNEHAFDVLRKKQEGKDFFIPSKSRLLAYADQEYVEENEYRNNILTFLKNVLFMSDVMADNLLCEVEYMFSEGKNIVDILAGLEEQGLELLNSDMKQSLGREIQNYTNYIRLWENRGNNMVELGIAENPTNVVNFLEAKKTIVRSEKKVGRNEPCPCGSGKKYKHCCGK